MCRQAYVSSTLLAHIPASVECSSSSSSSLLQLMQELAWQVKRQPNSVALEGGMLLRSLPVLYQRGMSEL